MFPDPPVAPFYSTTDTLKSGCICAVVGLGHCCDGVDSVGVVDLGSFVATPTPRHKGHAFRPDPNHYTLSVLLWGGEVVGWVYLIDTFSVENVATAG
jgi:hypothetical protein